MIHTLKHKIKLLIIITIIHISLYNNLLAINNDILNTHIIKTKKEVFNISYIKRYNTKQNKNYYVFLIGIYLLDTKAKNHIEILNTSITLNDKNITKIKTIDNEELINISFINTRAKYFLAFFDKNLDDDRQIIDIEITRKNSILNFQNTIKKNANIDTIIESKKVSFKTNFLL
jgi:hypothetical protein